MDEIASTDLSDTRDTINVMRLIDQERYSITLSQHSAMNATVAKARDDLARLGCARISGFIRTGMHPTLVAETDQLARSALYSKDTYTPYGTPPDDNFPKGHPRCRTHRTTSGNVTRDLIPNDFWIQCLYQDKKFQNFIAQCLDAEQIFEFADPMRGLTVNVMTQDTSLGWHFDANEFVVSLMTRRADHGGLFEYCPTIRSPGNENYASVEAVLDGSRDQVQVLDLQVGDLQIFKGRYALHRVTPVHGTRHTVLLGYSRNPGFIGSVDSTMRVYGRVMQAHIDAEHRRHADGLTD